MLRASVLEKGVLKRGGSGGDDKGEKKQKRDYGTADKLRYGTADKLGLSDVPQQEIVEAPSVSLLELPLELITYILSFVALETLPALARVSKFFPLLVEEQYGVREPSEQFEKHFFYNLLVRWSSDHLRNHYNLVLAFTNLRIECNGTLQTYRTVIDSLLEGFKPTGEKLVAMKWLHTLQLEVGWHDYAYTFLAVALLLQDKVWAESLMTKIGRPSVINIGAPEHPYLYFAHAPSRTGLKMFTAIRDLGIDLPTVTTMEAKPKYRVNTALFLLAVNQIELLKNFLEKNLLAKSCKSTGARYFQNLFVLGVFYDQGAFLEWFLSQSKAKRQVTGEATKQNEKRSKARYAKFGPVLAKNSELTTLELVFSHNLAGFFFHDEDSIQTIEARALAAGKNELYDQVRAYRERCGITAVNSHPKQQKPKKQRSGSSQPPTFDAVYPSSETETLQPAMVAMEGSSSGIKPPPVFSFSGSFFGGPPDLNLPEQDASDTPMFQDGGMVLPSDVPPTDSMSDKGWWRNALSRMDWVGEESLAAAGERISTEEEEESEGSEREWIDRSPGYTP